MTERASSRKGPFDILERSIDAGSLRSARCITPELKGKVQVLEVLVVETLANFVADLRFSVTRASGDGGVDFVATGYEYNAPSLRLSLATTIKGQVKRRARKDHLLTAIGSNYTALAEHARRGLSAFIFVYSTNGPVSPSDLRKFAETHQLDRLYNGPVHFIDARNFFSIWAETPDFLRKTLHGGLPAEEIEGLLQAIGELTTKQSTSYRDRPAARSDLLVPVLPRRVVASRPFRIEVHFHAGILELHAGLRLHWDAVDGIRLRRPMTSLSPAGARVTYAPGRPFEIEFVVDAPGRAALGSVRLIDRSGIEWAARDLGAIDVHPGAMFQRPPEFKDAYEDQRALLFREAEMAVSEGYAAVALVGYGGIGKSMLVENILVDLEGREFSVIAVEHEANTESERAFVRTLLLAITEVPESGASTLDSLHRWARRAIVTGLERLAATINALFCDAATPSQRELAELLFAALADRARDQPLVLHLSNLHWAGALELGALSELLRILQPADILLRRGVFWILEGRTAEQIGTADRSRRAPEAWQRMLSAGQIRVVELRSWDEETGGRFVRFLLGTINFVGSRSEIDRIVRWALENGGGNPMHLLECMRSLAFAWTAERHSLLASPPPRRPRRNAVGDPVEYRADRSTVHTISMRIGHAEAAFPEAVALLTVAARFGSRVDAEIWCRLVATTEDRHRALEEIRALDVVELFDEVHDGPRFIHENYHRAFLERGARKLGVLRDAVLSHVASTACPSIRQILGEADLLTEGGASSPDVAARLLGRLASPPFRADARARVDLIDHILRLPSSAFVGGSEAKAALRLELADALVASVDWGRARDELTGLLTGLDNDAHAGSALLHLRTSAALGNMLGNLPDTSRGLEVVRAAIAQAESTVDAGQSNPAVRDALEIAWNRMGVLHWFEGGLAQSTSGRWRAFRSARRRDPGSLRDALLTNEMAMPMMHRYPARATAMLEWAADRVMAAGDGADSSLDYILVQRQIARLVAATGSCPSVRSIRCILDETRTLLARPAFRRSVYGDALGHLVCGTAAVVLSEKDLGEHHFTEAIWIAQQGNMSRVLWKARLGLAQMLRRLDDHADVRPLTDGVVGSFAEALGRVRAEASARLKSTWALPLAHCVRLSGDPDSRVTALVAAEAVRWSRKDWDLRPTALSHSRQPMQILHIRQDDDDFFLMG